MNEMAMSGFRCAGIQFSVRRCKHKEELLYIWNLGNAR